MCRGFEPPSYQNFCNTSCTPEQGTLLSLFRVQRFRVHRSSKAVGPVYMYLNINMSMHVVEGHSYSGERGIIPVLLFATFRQADPGMG